MLNHLKTIRAGQPGYNTPRARATIDLWHDQKRYVYEMPHNFRHAVKRDFKLCLAVAFDAEITGRAPSYTIA